jgi:AcrR family transcriptional regulator
LSTQKRTRLTREQRRELIEQAAVEVFAERGFRSASMDEIAKRSGVSVPVVYDHFASKLDLYKRLLERTRNELLEMWGAHLFGDEPADVRIPRALDAWSRYVEANRDATRMYFRDADGDDAAEAVHKEIRDQARVALGVVLGRIVDEPRGQEQLEMAGEVIRAGLVGLALWWHEHQHVPREQIVETGLEVLWRGYLSAAGQTIR